MIQQMKFLFFILWLHFDKSMPPHHRRYYCLIGAIALCVLFPKGILSNSLVARDNTLICDLFHNIYIHITYGINAMFGCGGNDSGRSFQIPLLLLGGAIIFTTFLCTLHLWHMSHVWFWWQCQWLLCSKCSLPKTETFKFPCCCWVGCAISASAVGQMHFQDGSSLHWQVGIHNLRVWVSKNKMKLKF